ncbi:unnamed protein product, partial [Prorocentrum cordatum]
ADDLLRTGTTKSVGSTRSSLSPTRPAIRDSVAPGTEMGSDPLEDRLCRQSDEALAALDRARRALEPSEAHVTDFVLLRFLKCNQLDDLDVSLQQLRRRLQWEKDPGNQNLEDLVAGAELELATLEESYPQGWHGVDRYGRPVKIERLGKVDAQRLACPEVLPQARRRFLLDCEMLLREKFPACSLAAGHLVHRFTNVIDLQGLSFHTASDPQCRALIKQLLVTSKHYFPEVMGKTIIVNAPRIFSISWSALKSSLDQAVLDRIEIVGQDPRIMGPCQAPAGHRARPAAPVPRRPVQLRPVRQGLPRVRERPLESDPAIRAEVRRTSHHELIASFAADSTVAEPHAAPAAPPAGAAAEEDRTWRLAGARWLRRGAGGRARQRPGGGPRGRRRGLAERRPGGRAGGAPKEPAGLGGGGHPPRAGAGPEDDRARGALLRGAALPQDRQGAAAEGGGTLPGAGLGVRGLLAGRARREEHAVGPAGERGRGSSAASPAARGRLQHRLLQAHPRGRSFGGAGKPEGARPRGVPSVLEGLGQVQGAVCQAAPRPPSLQLSVPNLFVQALLRGQAEVRDADQRRGPEDRRAQGAGGGGGWTTQRGGPGKHLEPLRLRVRSRGRLRFHHRIGGRRVGRGAVAVPRGLSFLAFPHEFAGRRGQMR